MHFAAYVFYDNVENEGDEYYSTIRERGDEDGASYELGNMRTLKLISGI